MMINTFEQALLLANEFLATKERKNYYESQSIYEPCPEYVGMLVDLSDDMVSQIRTLKERYGEDFVSHLHEVIDDEDLISDMFYGEPADIDLDHVRHQYAFNIHELKPDGTVSDCSQLVELKDDDYARLLGFSKNQGFTGILVIFYLFFITASFPDAECSFAHAAFI